jgi:hypothetical protein
MITILKIEFKPKDIIKVTFVNDNGFIESVRMSREFIDTVLDINKLKSFIDNR